MCHYQIDADTRPAILAPAYTGHFRVLLDTPRGLLPLHPGRHAANHASFPMDPSSDSFKTVAAAKEQADQSFELRRNIYAAGADQGNASSAAQPPPPPSALNGSAKDSNVASGEKDEEEKNIEEGFGCDVCGVDCTRVRYHHLSQRDFELCPACYTEGRFPSNMRSGDFVRLDQSVPQPGPDAASEPWSAQERLLLLEGLEMFDDDWDKIAAHVGGRRSKEECIAHFLRLPIEDQYLANNEADLGPLKHRHPALSSTDNPVLGVVSFLASIVDPKVASAASESAQDALASKLRSEPNAAASASDEKQREQSPSRQEDADMPDASSTRVDQQVKSEDSDEPPVKRAARSALGSAAARAHLLAQAEDRELHQLTRQAIEEQVKKLEDKMSAFTEMEHLLDLERRSVEQAKSQLLADRLNISGHMSKLQDVAQRLGPSLPDSMKDELSSLGLASSAVDSSTTSSRAVKVEGDATATDQSMDDMTFGAIA